MFPAFTSQNSSFYFIHLHYITADVPFTPVVINPVISFAILAKTEKEAVQIDTGFVVGSMALIYKSDTAFVKIFENVSGKLCREEDRGYFMMKASGTILVYCEFYERQISKFLVFKSGFNISGPVDSYKVAQRTAKPYNVQIDERQEINSQIKALIKM